MITYTKPSQRKICLSNAGLLHPSLMEHQQAYKCMERLQPERIIKEPMDRNRLAAGDWSFRSVRGLRHGQIISDLGRRQHRRSS